MQDSLMFLKGMAILLATAFAFFLFMVWLVSLGEKRNRRTNSWLLIFIGPLLRFLSRLGINVLGLQDRRPSDAQAAFAGSSNRFRTIRAAKDYLARRIAEEAEGSGSPLTEVERKMLYFSEEGSTFPDVSAVSAQFDRDYNQDEYEKRIASLVRKIEARDATQDHLEQEAWDEAVEKLRDGDHYLSVLVNPSLSGDNAIRPPHDVLKLWLTAAGIVFAGIAWVAVLTRLLGPRFWDDQDWLSFHKAGGLLVLVPIILLIAIGIRHGWIVMGRK